jgi:hypothetical protein
MSDAVKVGQEVQNLFRMKLTGYQGMVPNSITPDIKLNKNDFRCEEFKTNHEGAHILFSGCSVTYGQGLLENQIWPTKLYNKIKENTKVSGFFNLAIPGTGVCEIVANIFKYIHNVGKPDLIFVCMPNFQRRYISQSKEQYNFLNIHHGVYKDGESDDYYDIIQIHSFHYLMFLEMFCKSENIKLYYFSYNNKYPSMALNRLFKINDKDLAQSVAEYSIKNVENKYALLARDDVHFGEAYHEYWANFCYNLYLEELNK